MVYRAPYDSIYTWNQFRDVFLAHYYPVSKKLNHKDRVNNFVSLSGESVSSSWDRFTSFLRSVPNHCIDDELLKEYFYQGQVDNNKVVLDTIAGGSYGECHYAEIAEKLERISQYIKAWSTRKSDTGRNTFVVQSTHNPTTDEIHEEMTQMKTELGLVLKQVTGCKKVTTRGGKKIIDPPIPSSVENVVRGDDEVVGVSGELKDKTGKEAEVPQKVTSMPRRPSPFPQRLVKNTKDGKYRCFITMLKQLSSNVPLIDGLEQMPGYAKFMKDMVTKKRSISFEDDDRMHHCSAIATRYLVQKKEDLGAFTIRCTIGLLHFAKALCDLGANINPMPFFIYKMLGLGNPKPTAMRLLMADQTVKSPIGILHDVLVNVASFIFSADFVILDCEVDFKVLSILGSPLLATGRALVDMEKGQMKF
ncbi:uncharacterized protein [Solanum lycopersicum]|uniref:uncharacterized protein n=1 Tax=Solanum lycopersicum TaxID=4081 RepID=UPI003748EA47